MRLKRYIEFIKEAIYINKIPTDYSLNKETLEDLFYDFTDNDWLVSIEIGFSQDDEFKKLITVGTVKPAYWIKLKAQSSSTSNDLTVFLKEILNRLEDFSNGKIKIYDTHWDNSPEFITSDINNLGFTVSNEVVYDNNNTDDEFSILLTENKEIDTNPKFLSEYYNWSVDNIIDNKLYVHVDLETISSILFKSNYYLDILLNNDDEPMDGFWDNYYGNNYLPDLVTMMDYYLNKENTTLLINAIIKEAGGISEVKNHIGNEMSDDIYDNIKDLEQPEFVKFIESERFYETLESISKYSDIMSDVKQSISDWLASAHGVKNFNELLDEFDHVVNRNFNIKRKFKSQGGVTLYEIEFNMEWIECSNYDDVYDQTLFAILVEYNYNSGFTKQELDPSFSDYGDIDIKGTNSEINHLLLRFLNK